MKSRKALQNACGEQQPNAQVLGGAEADDATTIKARNGEVIVMDAAALQGRDWMLIDLIVSALPFSQTHIVALIISVPKETRTVEIEDVDVVNTVWVVTPLWYCQWLLVLDKVSKLTEA